jgi:hypothetical protein
VQEIESSTMQNRIDALIKLEEEREKYINKLHQHQQIVKRWFDRKYSSDRNMEVGDLLKWDKAHVDKGEHTKFHKLWLGPFTITKKLGPSTFRLQNMEGQTKSLSING